MHRIALTVCLLIAVAPAGEAQEVPPWIVRAEAGLADHHKFVPDPRGPIGGVRVARVWARDLVRLDFGAAGSSADEGFFTADIGLELRLCRPDCRITSFVSAFVGTLAEPTYDDSGTSRAGGGVDIRLDPRQALRVAAYRARHDREARGPHTMLIGYSRRFGRD